jgi:hypothetical protein
VIEVPRSIETLNEIPGRVASLWNETRGRPCSPPVGERPTDKTPLGAGLVADAGREALPLRALAGASVRCRLLRVFRPFAMGTALLSAWLTFLGIRLTAPSAAAILSALVVVVGISVAAALCAAIAARIGERIDGPRTP